MAAARRILLGHVSGAHGIRGEVLIHSHTADPAAIGDYGPLTDEHGADPLSIRVVRVTQRGVLARIGGVNDRNAAEALAGRPLFVDATRLPPAGEREFYHADLIGLAAVDPDGTPVGEVIAVHNFGAGDLVEIRLAGGRRTEFLPFDDRFVPTVDLAARRLVVVMPPDDDPTPNDCA